MGWCITLTAIEPQMNTDRRWDVILINTFAHGYDPTKPKSAHYETHRKYYRNSKKCIREKGGCAETSEGMDAMPLPHY